MKITKVETIRFAPQPNILWARLYTDDGLIGLGETFYLPGAVEAVVHDMISGFLLGSSPYDIERIWDSVFSWTNFFGYAGAEMRALSAVNIAMWDLVGQSVGQPIYNLLGGLCRDRLRVYNTCVNGGPYPDFTDTTEWPAELARSLYDQGIRAMKIWPWDRVRPSFSQRRSHWNHTVGGAGAGGRLSLAGRPGSGPRTGKEDSPSHGEQDGDPDRGTLALGPELRAADCAGA